MFGLRYWKQIDELPEWINWNTYIAPGRSKFVKGRKYIYKIVATEEGFEYYRLRM